MTVMVWVENPLDGGSAVWGCSGCAHGAWCFDHTVAHLEARAHARSHGVQGELLVLTRQHGPRPDETRDEKIHRLRSRGDSIRAIAATVGLSTAGVMKALKRPRKEPA